MLENNTQLVRHKRRVRFETAQLLVSLSSGNAMSTDLAWSALLELPDWCRWPKQEQQRLLLVSGALFSAPTIRLWIDSERIKKARSLIGDKTFQLVLMNDVVPKNIDQVVRDDNVENLFLTAGASVLLGSTPKSFRRYIDKVLPPAAGDLPDNISRLLLSEALKILSEINNINESQQVEKEEVQEKTS